MYENRFRNSQSLPPIQLDSFHLPAKYYVCEFLNVANVVFQFYFTNFFLDGQFARVAREGIHLEENNSVLPILSECRMTMSVATNC